MSALQLIVTAAGIAAIVNAENTGTDPVLISQVGVTDQVFDAAAVSALPGELKRLSTFAGAAVADDTVHITIRDDSADSYTLRGFALYLGDGTVFGIYSHAGETPDYVMQKASAAMLLLSADVRFAQIDATSLTFGDSDWINPPGTETTPGVLELATDAETATGTDGTRAVHPKGLKALLDSRFGLGAPSAFVKSLLSVATAALMRTALELKSAALKDEGANNGLDADLLDGQHGAYYRNYGNLTNVPGSFPPSAHSHVWANISDPPSTATRWPAYSEVTGKPSTFAPDPHTHAAADITSGQFVDARIPALAIAKTTGLQGALDARAVLGANAAFSDVTASRTATPTHGYYYFGNSGARYLGWDGTNLMWNGPSYGQVNIWHGGNAMMQSADGGNCDDITRPGEWVAHGLTGSNFPGSYCSIVNLHTRGTFGFQLAGTFGQATEMYVRTKWDNGGFNPWRKLWHDGNFDPATKANLSAAVFSGYAAEFTAASGNGAAIRVRSPALASGLDIGASPALAGGTDPDVYLYNRNNGAIWFGTNNSLRGKMLADGTFEWNGKMRVNNAPALSAGTGLGIVGAVLSSGGSGGFAFDSRNDASKHWLWYSVNGAARLYLDPAGDLFAVTEAGVAQAVGGFQNTSSRKVKNIDGPLPYGLAELLKIETVIGSYKTDYLDDAGKKRLFILAEQLAEHVPEPVDCEAVEYNGEKVAGVDYMQLIPLLIKSLQQEHDLRIAENDALSARVAALEAGR